MLARILIAIALVMGASAAAAQSLPEPMFGRGNIVAVRPFGTYNDATALSVISNGTLGTTSALAQVLGLHTASEAASYQSRDQVTLYVGQTAPDALATASTASYTATSLVPTVPLSAATVTAIQAALASCAKSGRVVCMLIDTAHSPKFTGAITGVASNGTTVAVSGWFQQGNTATGQVPSDGVAAYINPVTKVWNINGVSSLPATALAKSSTFIEGDLYNSQASYVGTGSDFPGMGVSMNCDSTNACSYGYLALHNFYSGFVAGGSTQFGYWVKPASGSDGEPLFGFASYQTTGHPFGFNPGGTGYAWSVTNIGGVNIGNPLLNNSAAITPGAPGTAPAIVATGPDTNVGLDLITQAAGYVHARSGLLVDGTANVGYQIGSADAALQIGASRTASGNAYINLIGDTTNTTYGLRVLRGSGGVNATSSIDHRGTGNLTINTPDSASILLTTGGTTRLTVSAAGNTTVSGQFTASQGSTTTPTTVAGLGTCTSPLAGKRWAVSDALSPTPGSALTGGGAVTTGAFCNGSTWINL